MTPIGSRPGAGCDGGVPDQAPGTTGALRGLRFTATAHALQDAQQPRRGSHAHATQTLFPILRENVRLNGLNAPADCRRARGERRRERLPPHPLPFGPSATWNVEEASDGVLDWYGVSCEVVV